MSRYHNRETTQLQVLSRLPQLVNGKSQVLPANITTKFREAFEAYDPVSGGKWTQQLADNDLVVLDGNTASASYLVISKCPMTPGQTSIESVATFGMPFEMALGLHLSQRTLGQEFSVDVVSDEPAMATPADLAIASISQTTTTLTVNTTLPHNLRPGMRIGIRDCADSRMNYPALVVSSTPTPTSFTVTAGPGGNIPSVTAGPFTSGFVYFRSAMGLAPNGTSMIFENATATNASFYVRSESGDVLPSGAIQGNHAVAIATTASVQAVTVASSYSFQPTSEYRLAQFINGIQWSDGPVDTLTTFTNRSKRTQVVPDVAHSYKLRFRAVNQPSLTRPIAQIVSAVKSGTTTATITTDVPHGLTINDLVVIYGIRDQAAASFPNLLTATAVASVVNATQFTVVIGTASTVTSYGGYVARVNGGSLMSANGGIAQAIQSVTRTSNVLTIVGSAAWAGLSIGDYVNIVGCRNNVDGTSLGIDGRYRVQNAATTTLTLEQINSTVSPGGTDISLTDCGGAIIKRTDLRISFVRALDFERQRVEILPRPTGDIAESISVAVQNTVPVSGTVTATVASTTVAGTVAVDAAIGNPVTTGLRASNANITAMSAAGDNVPAIGTMIGVQVTKPYALPEAEWAYTGALTTTSDVVVQTAAGAGIKRHVTWMQATNTGGTAVDVLLRDGTTTRLQVTIPAGQSIDFPLPTGIPLTANTALNVALSAVGTVRVNLLGYTAP